MIVSSIEIGRRGYEFNAQHIDKTKNIEKNIVFPKLEDFHMTIVSSLEELGLRFEDFSNLKEISNYISRKKNPKLMYRIPLTDKVKVFKLKSNKLWTKLLVS